MDIVEEKEIDTCDVVFVDEERINSIRANMKSQEIINSLSETFSVLSDPTRLKIVLALSDAELCVCDIANLLSMSNSAISHQLRILRNLRLVKYEKRGKMVYYSLDDFHIENLIGEGLKHMEE